MDAPDADSDRTVMRPAAVRVDVSQTAGSMLPLGTRLGEFELVRLIGEGGFGIVYGAIDHTLQRSVAVKEFMPSSLAGRDSNGKVIVKSERHRPTFELALRSFVSEARMLAHFDHPALVKVHRFWEGNGTAYMAMPLYEGQTLQAVLRQSPAAPSELLLKELLGPLTEALLVLHEEHCYHRDIAPDNIILLAGSGQPLLLDFGAARRVIGDMTQALTVILKPGYAPIEQYAETPGLKQGPWTDVYALAAVVYYAMTQRIPPSAVARMVDDHYERAAVCAAGQYSDKFLRAIDRALEVRPTERTQSIAQFRKELGFAPPIARQDSGWSHLTDSGASKPAALHAGDTSPSPLASAPSLISRSSGHRARILGLLVAAVVVIASGVWLWQRVTSADAAIVAGARPGSPDATVVSNEPTVNATTAGIGTAATPPVVPDTHTPVSSPAPDPFERINAAQTSDFAVSAQPVKSTLRIKKDALHFAVTSNRDGFVHVLLREPDGSMLLLFPNKVSANNRISASQRLLLPQPSWPLQALEPPGVQRLLIVVTESATSFDDQRQAPRGDFAALGPALAAPAGRYGAATFDVETVR